MQLIGGVLKLEYKYFVSLTVLVLLSNYDALPL